MATNFMMSETKENLMKSFAGESQARNRYTLAWEQANSSNLFVLGEAFIFTANQELAHAKIFYDHLKDLAGESININADYPVDISNSMIQIVEFAAKHEFDEYDILYKNFGNKAMEEGYPEVANSFFKIAEIEKTHNQRFETFVNWMRTGSLFENQEECEWMCLNCGHIHKGKSAPTTCPVCSHNQGFFIRKEYAPYCK